MRLFCCHMINRIFIRKEIPNNFPHFINWLQNKGIKYQHTFDFIYFKKWILEETQENLEKNISLLHKKFFWSFMMLYIPMHLYYFHTSIEWERIILNSSRTKSGKPAPSHCTPTHARLASPATTRSQKNARKRRRKNSNNWRIRISWQSPLSRTS